MLDSNEMKETCERLKAYPTLLENVKGMQEILLIGNLKRK